MNDEGELTAIGDKLQFHSPPLFRATGWHRKRCD